MGTLSTAAIEYIVGAWEGDDCLPSNLWSVLALGETNLEHNQKSLCICTPA